MSVTYGEGMKWLGHEDHCLRYLTNQPLGSSSCNVATTKMSLAVHGIYASFTRIREIGGAKYGPTGLQFSAKVFQHYGLENGPDYRMFYWRPWSEVRDLIERGWHATLYIDNGYLNNKARSLSGDKNFDGTHAVLICGRWWSDRRNQWRVGMYDPLHDGRRDNIPDGPINAPQWPYRIAAGKVAGEGRVHGYAVKKR